uniref:U5 snRNP protein, DIM1 family n=1 Tax=Tetraselmis sp. GSL018 TaxID=582737 RepID=A0A061QZS0_9CHLO
MSYLLPHLHSGWAVDQAILAEEERVVVIRFGHDWDETCMEMDEIISSVADKCKNFAVFYLVDISEVRSGTQFQCRKQVSRVLLRCASFFPQEYLVSSRNLVFLRTHEPFILRK